MLKHGAADLPTYLSKTLRHHRSPMDSMRSKSCVPSVDTKQAPYIRVRPHQSLIPKRIEPNQIKPDAVEIVCSFC